MEPNCEELETQKIQEQFDEICIELNVDQKVADIAWRGYEAVRKQCTLEGSQVPWLACSVYVASWLCPPQNLSSQNGQKAAPLAIIDKCGLSIIDFFEKLQKWVDMANMSKKYHDQVVHMESCFAVASVIFKKFEPIFNDMFKNNANNNNVSEIVNETTTLTPEKQKSTRTGTTTRNASAWRLSFNDVKAFCWNLFIFIKRSSLGIQDDLVKSHHLMLCCLDLMWSNVLASKRKDLLNESFDANFTPTSNVDDQSLIELLCTNYDGMLLDAKQMRFHWFCARIKQLVGEQVLQGDDDTLTEFLSTSNFAYNLKSMQDNYEKLILKKGDMDERIFLPRTKLQDAYATPPAKIRKLDSGSVDSVSIENEKEISLRRNVQACLDRVSQFQVPTPLTSRRLLDSDCFCPINPVSTLQSASKLQLLLTDATVGPSQSLSSLLHVYKPDPLAVINKITSTMGGWFLKAFIQDSESNESGNDENLNEFAAQRKDTAEMLYYKILEKIIKVEREKATQSDLSHVLNQEIFHKALVACCYELVLFSFNSQKTFPWILKVFDIHAFHFYKVIELVIRPEPDFSRDMVKHLNQIEERVLEELAWTQDSPLWTALGSQRVPTCEEVALPAPLNRIIGLPSVLAGNLRQNFAGGSPFNSTNVALQQVRLPVGPAKRRLDFDSDKSITPVPSAQQAQTTSQSAAPFIKLNTISVKTTANTNTSDSASSSSLSIQLIKPAGAGTVTNVVTAAASPGHVISKSPGQSPASASKNTTPPKPQSGSLALFFRKVYYLTSLRLHDLCERCRGSDTLKQNAWTVFHYVLTNHVTMMKQRHIDQLLMCSLYIISKVTKFDISFHDIMSNYRQQPQAKSRVYRNVLLGSKPNTPTADVETNSNSNPDDPISSLNGSTGHSAAAPKLRSGSTLPVPAISSAPPTPTPIEEEEHGDLIKFYNSIFITKVEEFAKKFDLGDDPNNKNPITVPLSPLPPVKPYNNLSPRRRVIDSIYVSPMKSNNNSNNPASFMMSPSRPLRYCFSRSPAKDLRAINNMLKSSAADVKPVAGRFNVTYNYSNPPIRSERS